MRRASQLNGQVLGVDTAKPTPVFLALAGSLFADFVKVKGTLDGEIDSASADGSQPARSAKRHQPSKPSRRRYDPSLFVVDAWADHRLCPVPRSPLD